MEILINTQMLVALILLSIRIMPLFILTPLLTTAGVPTNVLILWVLGLSVVMLSGLKIEVSSIPTTISGFIMAGTSELLIGMLFAFGLFTLFGAFHFGGRILDVQMGFGVATLIDPATSNQAPLIGTFLNMLAVVVFVTAGGINLLLEGIAFSIEHFPIGQGFVDINLSAIVAQFGSMFIYSVMVVAPAMVAILLLDVGLGVMARTMPQVNVFIVSLPLKIFLGLFMMMIAIHYLTPVMFNMFEDTFLYMETVLG
jgi:flagellar biosynthesis protein FliR